MTIHTCTYTVKTAKQKKYTVFYTVDNIVRIEFTAANEREAQAIAEEMIEDGTVASELERQVLGFNGLEFLIDGIE